MRRHTYKKLYLWTPSIAYITGLIASDGCLSNDGRHLNITSNDLEILNNARNILNLRVKIGIKKNGFGGYGSQIQFGDVALYDFLLKAGLTPAKSKTLYNVKVPDEYYGDFLRGLFDGDGTVYGYWDRRWRSSFMYYAGFTSASPKFLKWLQLNNSRIGNVGNGDIRTGTRSDTLYYAKKDSRKVFDLMYSDFDAPCLSRKRNKFIDFLKLDPYPDKALLARVAESVDAAA